MALHVALFEPEIPPNTGNIIRLCANSGAHLHVIEPTGFAWDDKRMRRAGLDYHEFADVQRYPSYATFSKAMVHRRVYACSTHGRTGYADVEYQDEDVLLFGPESRGLPPDVREDRPDEQVITIPMHPDSRSLNLSNAVAIILFEAWRQQGFV